MAVTGIIERWYSQEEENNARQPILPIIGATARLLGTEQFKAFELLLVTLIIKSVPKGSYSMLQAGSQAD